MYQNQYRVTDYLMTELFERNENVTFGLLSDTKHNQYFLEQQLPSSVVYNQKQLNKLYSDHTQIEYSNLEYVQKGSLKVRMLLREGFPWNEQTFGYLITIKNLKNGDILLSNVFKISDVMILDKFLLIDNRHWTGYVDYTIPKFDSSLLSISAIRLDFEDINYQGPNANGVLYNFPTETDFVPFISSNPIPDFIGLKAELDSNMFLTVGINTTENKTVQKSLIDYFEESFDSQISVEYQIDYGNSTVGYKSFRVSNNFSKFAEIKFMPDYQPNQEIDIVVTMQVKVNEKLMERQISLTHIDTSFVQRLTEFESIELNHYPVNVEESYNPNYDVKQITPKQRQIIERIIPIYIRNVTSDIDVNLDLKQSGRVITFDSLELENSQLQFIHEDGTVTDYLNPYKTTDNVWYFDCRLLSVIPKIKEYQIMNLKSGKLLRRGKVTV